MSFLVFSCELCRIFQLDQKQCAWCRNSTEQEVESKSLKIIFSVFIKKVSKGLISV